MKDRKIKFVDQMKRRKKYANIYDEKFPLFKPSGAVCEPRSDDLFRHSV